MKLKLICVRSLVFGLLWTLPVFAGEWREHETRLQSLSARLKTKQEEMDKIIEEKKLTTNKEQLHTMMEDLAKVHREFLEKELELRELKNHIRFYHPEHGVEVERQYTPVRKADIEKYEAELGIDGKLNRVKQKVREIYGKDRPAAEVKNGETKNAVVVHESSPAVPVEKSKSIIKPEPQPDRIKLSQ